MYFSVLLNDMNVSLISADIVEMAFQCDLFISQVNRCSIPNFLLCRTISPLFRMILLIAFAKRNPKIHKQLELVT